MLFFIFQVITEMIFWYIFKMGESLGLGKKSSGPETDTETWSWFRLPKPKPGFGRTLLFCYYSLYSVHDTGLICCQSGVGFDRGISPGPVRPLFPERPGLVPKTSPSRFAWGYSDKFAQIVLHLHGYGADRGQRNPASLHTQWKVGGQQTAGFSN